MRLSTFVSPGSIGTGLPLLGIALAMSLTGTACKKAKADIALSKQAAAPDVDDGTIPNVPVPAENGPKLVALSAAVTVYERPFKSAPAIGSLRFGAQVARAAEPFKKNAECEGGFYPVRPRGFVCADASVSLESADIAPAPDTSKALPYRYASVKAATPLYSRLPTRAEQLENEPGLERHLAKVQKREPVSLRAGSNDVPLDERGVPSGIASITKGAEGVGEDGKRTAATFFQFAASAPAPALPDRGSLVAMVMRRGSSTAITGSVSTDGPSGPREFGITPEANYIPLDKVEPVLGSTWHGVDLTKEKGLPIGFVLRHEVSPYALGKGKAKRLDDEELEKRTPVFLTGRFRTVESVQYDEAEDGTWLRSKDIIKVVKKSKFPDFVQAGTKWVDVSLALQTITLYEGKKPIYASLISSGKDMLGDPATSAATMQGTFTITKKAATMTIDPREVDQAFDVFHAPYGLELTPGFAVVGSTWSDPSGEARGFHNIALTPIDAHRLYAWAGPEVPTGWSWITPTADEAITVHVRK
ncbi:MAG: L,D-transpeptidase [Myxococcales bacterium]|nr:L,D-transpeptidase [Myxococcales bacterium]